jgi:hypothetical protein
MYQEANDHQPALMREKLPEKVPGTFRVFLNLPVSIVRWIRMKNQDPARSFHGNK